MFDTAKKWTKCTEIQKNLAPSAKKYGHSAQKRPILDKIRQNRNNPMSFNGRQISLKDSQVTIYDNQKATKRAKNGKKNKNARKFQKFRRFPRFSEEKPPETRRENKNLSKLRIDVAPIF